MSFFRGDAHKIYMQLKENRDAIHESKYLKELYEVRKFYESLESDVLQLVYYRLVKEKNGSGMIPIFVSSIPFLFLIFSQHLQKILLRGRNEKLDDFHCLLYYRHYGCFVFSFQGKCLGVFPS